MMHAACIIYAYLCVYILYLYILIKSILNNYQTFLWSFGKSLVDKFNPKSFFPTAKICHFRFNPVFGPSKDIMLDIEELKFRGIIPGSWDPVHLTKLHLNQEVDGHL